MTDTLPDEVRAALPDRDLTPDEGLRVSAALDADGVSRITYEDSDETIRILIMFLWWDRDSLPADVGQAGCLTGPEPWELEPVGVCDHAGFLDAIEDTAETFGISTGDQEILKMNDAGEVVDRIGRDL
jgi:hypothetical protein